MTTIAGRQLGWQPRYQPEFSMRNGRAKLVGLQFGHSRLACTVDQLRAGLESAMGELATRDRSGPSVGVGVRVTVDQLVGWEVGAWLSRIIETGGARGEDLEVELAHCRGLGTDAIAEIRALRAHGVTIAVDSGTCDFMRMPLHDADVVRLHGELVLRMAGDCWARRIGTRVVELAREHGLEVAARGVINCQQLRALRRIGCRRARGSLLMSPRESLDEAMASRLSLRRLLTRSQSESLSAQATS